jgi:hypothetical protein
VALSLLTCSAAAATWESRQVEVGSSKSDSLFGISCATASSCVAAGNRGTIVTSQNPGGGAGAWRSEAAAPGAYVGAAPGEPDRTSPGTFEAVSCPSVSMCAAVTYAGDFYASSAPADGAQTWRATDLDGTGADTHLRGISCPTPAFCVAVSSGGFGSEDANGGGKIISIKDPTSGSMSWLQAQLDESLDLQAVSCPTTDFCIAVANLGRIVASTNPAGAAPAWKEIGTPGGPGDLEGVDCPVESLCLAGNARSNILSSTDAEGAAPHWREANSGPSVQITGISCPTISRCAAVDNNGDVVVSKDPTGPSSAWSATNLLPYLPTGSPGQPFNALFGASCPSVSFCAAVGSRGVIFTSENPFEVEGSRPSAGKRQGRKRPRLKILRGDNFVRQSRTKGAGSKVTFRLRPYRRVRVFLCRLDGRKFRRCKSPLRIYAKLGRHVLRARAMGVTGMRGPVATTRFAIRRP